MCRLVDRAIRGLDDTLCDLGVALALAVRNARAGDQGPWPTATRSAHHRLDDKDEEMRQRSMLARGTSAPIRPLRILIEDPNVELSDSPQFPARALDVIVCSGPEGETDECPLVMNGTCPLGRFDVVVGALHDAWATSVRAAWAETGTPYADASRITAEDSTDRVAHHLGAAIQALYAPYHRGE